MEITKGRLVGIRARTKILNEAGEVKVFRKASVSGPKQGQP